MEDMNDRMRDRWQDRRKKGSNWPKLIGMVLLLVAILVAMNLLNKASQKSTNAVETTNITEQDSTQNAGGEGQSTPADPVTQPAKEGSTP